MPSTPTCATTSVTALRSARSATASKTTIIAGFTLAHRKEGNATAWIESHQELARHPKTFKLARLLGVSRPTVIGHLHLLWWWTLDYAPDGEISAFEPEDLAEGALWDGDAQTFVSALTSAGFLERHDDHLYVHDWMTYAGRLVVKREQNAERMRDWRATHVQRTSQARAGATVPNRTEPNRTMSVPQPAVADSASKAPDDSEPFGEDSPAYQLAVHLRERILSNDDHARVPKATPRALSKWSAEIDRLLRLDGREPAEVRCVIDWCQDDLFWRSNILSPPSLRKHFGRLNLAMKLPARNGRAKEVAFKATGPPTKSVYADDEEENGA